MTAAVWVRGLTRSYGAVRALRGIDLDVARGEAIALVGPNGAGKTTTLEILEGLRARTGGAVSVLGFDPARHDPRLRAQVGMVLQDGRFDPYLTVAETLALYRSCYVAPRPAAEVLDVVGLADRRAVRVRKLSAGQLRRLGVAVALVGDPRVVFLDEPTTTFDPAARRRLWSVLQALKRQGLTMVFTTNVLDEAELLADRMVVLVDGRIVADAPPATLVASLGGETRIRCRLPPGARPPEAVLGTASMVDGILELRAPDAVRTVHALTAWALADGVAVGGLELYKPTLEELYLRLASPGATAPKGRS